MSQPKFTAEQAKALLPYATEAQARCIQAFVAEGGNATKAANRLGLDRTTIRSALKSAQRRAARRGFAPEHGWNPPAERTAAANTLPEGFQLKGVSDFVDDEGNRKAAWIKSREERGEPEAPPPDFALTNLSQYTDGAGRLIGQWKAFSPEKVAQWQSMIDAVKASVAEFVRPLEPVTPPRFTDRGTMAVYPVGDPHVGMLAHAEETGDDHDLKIAEADLCGAMDRLVSQMPRSSIGVLVPLGDNFHADDNQQRTPAHHHKLDVDSRAHKVARVGVNTFRYMIDRMLTIHDEVHVQIVDGNHDPVTSMWLRFCLEGWYSKEPRVKIFTDPSPIRVWEFGVNMCAAAHGHGVKAVDMAGAMAGRFPQIWGRTKFHYGYQGHKHRRELVEKGGALIEVFQTLAGKDSFAALHAYLAGRSLVGITLHELFGEISRVTCDISWARSKVSA